MKGKRKSEDLEVEREREGLRLLGHPPGPPDPPIRFPKPRMSETPNVHQTEPRTSKPRTSKPQMSTTPNVHQGPGYAIGKLTSRAFWKCGGFCYGWLKLGQIWEQKTSRVPGYVIGKLTSRAFWKCVVFCCYNFFKPELWLLKVNSLKF